MSAPCPGCGRACDARICEKCAASVVAVHDDEHGVSCACRDCARFDRVTQAMGYGAAIRAAREVAP